ncbi:predicted protein [Naegleria gruberi]|uniref:Predicted protein n=1 Tax=Naegleria gruberi TaxID=5762 RepID=D2VVB6_NAEGR|nr:uncharacterized protein NAEGRDRAFT_72958 [Naegleria gruberi]EFC39208.1 predicted protein [Naegleria gruberi]|eukprot:XP_002671952.1 predicted protein [Naegleria gruberi strain NEG-M]
MKRKLPSSSSSNSGGNFDHHQQNSLSSSNSRMMEMIRSQKERRKKIKQQENTSSAFFIMDTLHGIYSEKKNTSSSASSEVQSLFNLVTIGLLADLSKCENSLEIFREKIEKYIVHSDQYRDEANLMNQFIVYHIYLSQEIFLCFLRSKSEAVIRDRLIEIGLKSILAFVNSNSNIIEYYFNRFFKFLNCEFINKLADRNVWIHMLSSTEFLQFTSKGIQRLFNVTSEDTLTLHITTLSLLQESQTISIPNFIMTCSDYFIDNLAHRTILENHNFESNPNIVQHFENVSYQCIWFITFYDKKRDTSKLLRFISNFRKVRQGENSPLMIWENLSNNLSNPLPLKSYMTLLKSGKKIIDKPLFQSFVISEFYNLFQVSDKLSTEEIFKKNKEPIYLTVEPGSDKILEEVFQWNMDNLENFNEQMCDILRELFSFQNLDFVVMTHFVNKLLKLQENTILKLLDELVLEYINREDIPGCVNCLIIGRNIFPIPKTMKPKNAVSNGNLHLSTIDQWMKDNFFVYLSSGGTNTGIERNTRQASFVTKLIEYIIPLENSLLLTLYQKVLNNLVNSRYELVSTLLNKIKKAQQSETETDQDSTADSDYEELKTILLEYEKYGENAYNTSSKSSILPLSYYPVMKKTKWCNVIVPQLLSFTLRDSHDGVMRTKFEKLKSALISSLVNRKLIPKDMIQIADPKEDSQGVESASSTLHLKVSLVEGCLLRVVSEIENQIKKQSTNIDSLLALFFECHTAITAVTNILKSETFDVKVRNSTQSKLVEIVLQSFYECCMVMGSFSQHEGLLVTILSDGNSQISETSSSQRKQNHLDWIVLFKVSVLMPLANVSSLIKDRILKLLKNINTKDSNSDLIFTMSVLLSSLITVSTNEVTIIQEFIELTNKGKDQSSHKVLANGLEERMALIKACFFIWDEIKPKNFVESIIFAKLIVSCLELCHHFQNYNSDFGESINVIDCISHNILEETFQRSIVEHFTSSQPRDNEFFCFIPAKMQRLYFWISSRYSLLFSQVDISSRKSEKVQQFSNLTKQDESKFKQVKNHLESIHSSFNNEFIDNLFNGIQLLDFDEWTYFELNIQDEMCHKVLSSYYKNQFLQYNTLLSSKMSQNSLPFMLSTLFSQALSFERECEHHSIMIQSLIGLIPKFSTNDQFSNQDQFWLFKSWLQAMQSSQEHSRKCLYDFVIFTEHLDPIIYYLGTYSLSVFSQDFDSNIKVLKNTLSQFSKSCLIPISHLHPWPVLFTSKILEGLFSLVSISLTWIPKRDTSTRELKQLFRNFITENEILKLNITRHLGLHVSNLETWIFNYFSNSQTNKEELLYNSKETLKEIVSDLERDYNFGLKFLVKETPLALLNTMLNKIDCNFGGLLISDMLISLFISPTASKYLDPFFELKEKTIEQLPSQISIHSQTILDYLDETKFSNTTDTNRLSKIIELVFGRISSLLNTQELGREMVRLFPTIT